MVLAEHELHVRGLGLHLASMPGRHHVSASCESGEGNGEGSADMEGTGPCKMPLARPYSKMLLHHEAWRGNARGHTVQVDRSGKALGGDTLKAGISSTRNP